MGVCKRRMVPARDEADRGSVRWAGLPAAVVSLGVCAVLAGAGGRSAAAQPLTVGVSRAASLPSTPVGKQARWLVGAVMHLPIPAAEIDAHFDRAVLAALPKPAAASLNLIFAGLTRLRVDAITTSTRDLIVFVVTVNATSKVSVSIAADAHGLISGLHLLPA